eukprot:6195251-Prymnesium_polylepis.3
MPRHRQAVLLPQLAVDQQRAQEAQDDAVCHREEGRDADLSERVVGEDRDDAAERSAGDAAGEHPPHGGEAHAWFTHVVGVHDRFEEIFWGVGDLRGLGG